MIKNVAFADMVTGETANFFMPDFIRTESSSTLIDMILQRALRCRGEKVFVLVMDCCASNYNGVIWAAMVWLVDELRWFEAVVLEYFMPRHGKGPADKVFGGHCHTWHTSEVLSEDHLAQAYCDASLGKETVSMIMPSAICDWRSYFENKTNGRFCKSLGIKERAWNEIVVVREGIQDSPLHADVKEYLSHFVSRPGWFRARNGYNDMHEYCVLPSVPPQDVTPAKPERLLKEVAATETSPGVFELLQFPVNRTNALSNGFNNRKLAAKSFREEIEICERQFEAALVPENYDDGNMRAHAMNFIN